MLPDGPGSSLARTGGCVAFPATGPPRELFSMHDVLGKKLEMSRDIKQVINLPAMKCLNTKPSKETHNHPK